MMPGILKASQREQRHEMPYVQAVAGRIEAAVKREWRGHSLRQFRRVGAIGDEAAPLEFIQNVHRATD
jgi:hypothetical protein